MMPRPTRSRQPSTKLSSTDYVVEIPKRLKESLKLRNPPTTQLRSTKGSNNKLSNVDVIVTLRSPVLRDRTNLTKEPTTKLDVLKKGLEVEDAAANAKVMTEMRTRRTKVIKPTIIQDTENIQVTETKTKSNILATKKESKISKLKKPGVPSSSTNKPVRFTENERETTNGKRVTRQVTKNENPGPKSLAPESKKSKKSAINEQLETVRKTRTRKQSVPDDKTESPPVRLSSRNKKKVSPTLSPTLSPTGETCDNQAVKRVPRLSNGKINKSPQANVGKKFFKSKLKTPATLPAHSKITPLKKRMVSKTQKAAVNRKNVNKLAVSRPSTSFRLRQPTLQESFAKQPKKILRPRKSSKNYCERSELATDESENKNKLETIEKKKGPVYKWNNESDKIDTDIDKVYEFIFDGNDSKERARKKRKKRIVRKAPAKKAKIMTKPSESKPSLSTELPAKKVDEPPPTARDLVLKKVNDCNAVKNDNKFTTVTAEIHLPPAEVSPVTTKSVPKRPEILSVEELPDDRRISLTVTPLQPRSINEEFLTLNKPNKFHLRPSAQFKTMMDASLLRRSLSPIPNETPRENIEMENPWRAPSFNTFSRVKNVFQSTPQGKKFGKLLGKASLVNDTTPKLQRPKMNKIAEKNDENANISLIKDSPGKIQTMNTSKSPRKFGTVISNINNNSPIKRQSMQLNTSKSPRKFGTVISNLNESLQNTVPIANERAKLPMNIEQSAVCNTISMSLPIYDEITSITDEFLHDKENSAPNNASTKKSPIEKNDSLHIATLRSENNKKSAEIKSDKVIEPQPGPSGLQKSNSSPDTWNLKQSNLNKFLNLPDMPSSTRINTPHGIFDEAHSTPIVGKPVKKVTMESLNVNNAFGFDDDDTDDIDVSPINRCSPIKQVLTENNLRPVNPAGLNESKDKVAAVGGAVQQPARLSIGEVKNKLLASKIAHNKKIHRENVKEKASVMNASTSNTARKDVIKAIEFSDTFDEIVDEVDKENVKEIPLFVDVEPVHFTQPPRYSYTHKRKRNMSWNTSEETEEDGEQEEHRKRTKKKRVGKAEREQQKIMEQWARSMNNTFEEIDHFDLLVE